MRESSIGDCKPPIIGPRLRGERVGDLSTANILVRLPPLLPLEMDDSAAGPRFWHSVHCSRNFVTASRGRNAYFSVICDGIYFCFYMDMQSFFKILKMLTAR